LRAYGSKAHRGFDKIAWSDFGRRVCVGPQGCGQESPQQSLVEYKKLLMNLPQ
jgi:hypothetical protein